MMTISSQNSPPQVPRTTATRPVRVKYAVKWEDSPWTFADPINSITTSCQNLIDEITEPLDERRNIDVINPNFFWRNPATKHLRVITRTKRYGLVFDKRVVDPIMKNYHEKPLPLWRRLLRNLSINKSVAKGRWPVFRIRRHLGFSLNNLFHTNPLIPTSLTRVMWLNAALWLVTAQRSDVNYSGMRNQNITLLSDENFPVRFRAQQRTKYNLLQHTANCIAGMTWKLLHWIFTPTI